MYPVKGKGSVTKKYVDGNGYLDDMMITGFPAAGPSRSSLSSDYGRHFVDGSSSSSLGGAFDHPSGSRTLNVWSNSNNSNNFSGHLSSSVLFDGYHNNSNNINNGQNLDGLLSDQLHRMHIGDYYGTIRSIESGERSLDDIWMNGTVVGRDLNCNNNMGDFRGSESLIQSPNPRIPFGRQAYSNVGMRTSEELLNSFAINGRPSFGEGFFYSPTRYEEDAGVGNNVRLSSRPFGPFRSFQDTNNLGLDFNYPPPIMNGASSANVVPDNSSVLLSPYPSQIWNCSSSSSSSADDYKHQQQQNFIIPHQEQEEGGEGLDYFKGQKMVGNVQASDYICNIAKNQLGCRILQKAFDQGTSQDVQLIFDGIIGRVVEFMVDQFGNYLVQKLLIFCNDEQRMQIVLRVTREPGLLVRISLDTHGTRVVQKLIETIKSRQEIGMVIEALEPGFLDLATDLNGNHVLHRCLQSFTKEHNKFIMNAAARHCFGIATHRYGCCVLNKCIGYSTGKQRDKLLASISFHAFVLAQDAFGNYVIQYMIEQKNQCTAALLLSQFQGNFVHLSKQKFSSHVVEKCLKFIEESRPIIIHELVSFPHFEHLLQDPFANYVIQSAFGVAKASLRALLVNAVRPHMHILRSNPFCKKILSQNILKKK
ncbi:unnamed protein product [Cuscuta epithymum]|uniref:PUM-HD domain-containing protein n=1 Tax=Cuscuta epithymum TaxID=186058 RepID=A0AAV0C663_9ASTE|nr:unnamed protein product [Cuscuta epithymum]